MNFVGAERIACEEKGVAYGLTPARPHSPERDATHPLGQIPLLLDGTFALFEWSIVSNVDRPFPGPRTTRPCCRGIPKPLYSPQHTS